MKYWLWFLLQSLAVVRRRTRCTVGPCWTDRENRRVSLPPSAGSAVERVLEGDRSTSRLPGHESRQSCWFLRLRKKKMKREHLLSTVLLKKSLHVLCILNRCSKYYETPDYVVIFTTNQMCTQFLERLPENDMAIRFSLIYELKNFTCIPLI